MDGAAGSDPPEHPLPDADIVLQKARTQASNVATLQRAMATLSRRQSRMAQLREQTLRLRSQAKFELTNCHNCHAYALESQQAFKREAFAIIELSTAESNHNAHLDRLGDLCSQAMEDFAAHDENVQKAKARQTELGDLECKLQRVEDSFKQALDSVNPILENLGLLGHGSTVTVTETERPLSPSTEVSVELDPLLSEYFKDVGAVNNLLEIANEMEFDYDEARGSRNFRLDQDEVLDTSDREFEAQWRLSREKNALELSEARRKAEISHKVCLDNGLDPEAARRRPQRDSDRSVSDADFDESNQPRHLSVDGSDSDRNHASYDMNFDADAVDSTDGMLTFQAHRLSDLDLEELPSGFHMAETPVTERVRNWMEAVDEHSSGEDDLDRNDDALDRLSRRSLSVTSPIGHDPKQRSQHTLLGRLAPTVRTGPSLTTSDHRTGTLGLRRRHSSDSDIAALLPSHKPDSDFVEDLRRSAAVQT